MATFKTVKANKLTPVHDHILVSDMVFGERLTNGGIIMPGDDRKSEGIRPRWGKVYAIGPKQADVKVGEYILVKHGRWTRGIDMEVAGNDVTVRRIDNDDILLVSETEQTDETFTIAHTAVSDRSKIEGSLHNDNSTRAD